MTRDELNGLCAAMQSAAPGALVVYSPPTLKPGGHATVQHAPADKTGVELAIACLGMATERIDEMKLKVRSTRYH